MKKIFLLLLIATELLQAQKRYPVADKTTGQSWNAAEHNLMSKAINSVPVTFIDMANQYGIVADGVTDNVTKLMQFNTDWKNYTGKIIAYFPNGWMLSSNNRWGFGIYNLECRALGNCKWSTIYNGSDEKLQRPYWNGDPYQTNTPTYVGTITYTTTYKRFNGAKAGDSVVTMTVAGDTSLYKPGTPVLFMSFEQVGNGFPPGARWNEWNVVKSNSLGSGKISLQKGFVFGHNNSNWDVPNMIDTAGSGLPRIMSLKRADYSYPINNSFYNITFGNPVSTDPTARGTFQPIAQSVYAENCFYEGNFFPSMIERMTIIGGGVVAGTDCVSEMDKQVGYFYSEGTFYNNYVHNGSSIYSMYYKHCRFMESVQVRPRYATFDNCDFRSNVQPDASAPALGGGPAGAPVNVLKIINACTFSKTATNNAPYAMDIPGLQNYVISTVTGNTIIIPNTGGFAGTNATKVYTMIKGARLFKSDGSKIGTIDSIYWDATQLSGAGAFMIAGNWPIPVNAETWYWSPVLQVIDDGTNKTHSGYSTSFQTYGDEMQLRANKENVSRKQTIKLHMEDFMTSGSDRTPTFSGWLTSVEADVTTVYSGSDAKFSIYIADSSFNPIFQLDLKTRGFRRLTQDKRVGMVGQDAMDSTQVNKFHRNMHVLVIGNNTNPVDVPKSKLPDFEIIITKYD